MGCALVRHAQSPGHCSANGKNAFAKPPYHCAGGAAWIRNTAAAHAAAGPVATADRGWAATAQPACSSAHGFHSTAAPLAEDYYSTLGIDRKASESEIKKAYYKLAKKYHPDTNKVHPPSFAGLVLRTQLASTTAFYDHTVPRALVLYHQACFEVVGVAFWTALRTWLYAATS